MAPNQVLNRITHLPPVILQRPRYGEACNGCGLCCSLEPCGIAKARHGDIPGPCPELVYDAGRYRCRLVLMETLATEMGLIPGEFQALVTEALGIGKGCDSEYP